MGEAPGTPGTMSPGWPAAARRVRYARGPGIGRRPCLVIVASNDRVGEHLALVADANGLEPVQLAADEASSHSVWTRPDVVALALSLDCGERLAAGRAVRTLRLQRPDVTLCACVGPETPKGRWREMANESGVDLWCSVAGRDGVLQMAHAIKARAGRQVELSDMVELMRVVPPPVARIAGVALRNGAHDITVAWLARAFAYSGDTLGRRLANADGPHAAALIRASRLLHVGAMLHDAPYRQEVVATELRFASKTSLAHLVHRNTSVPWHALVRDPALLLDHWFALWGPGSPREPNPRAQSAERNAVEAEQSAVGT